MTTPAFLYQKALTQPGQEQRFMQYYIGTGTDATTGATVPNLKIPTWQGTLTQLTAAIAQLTAIQAGIATVPA